MRITSSFRIAFRALRRNKMRSILTSLGIIMGVAAVITISGIGNGAKSQVEAQIASLGQNVILIFSGSFTAGGARTGWGGAGTLKVEDAEAIKREIPMVVGVSPEVRTTAQVVSPMNNWSTQVLGESEDYFTIRQWPFEKGDSFTPQDVRAAAKVAVIGKTVEKLLFGEEDAIGQIIRVKGLPFTVVGVLAPKGMSLMGQDQDDVVIVPYTSAMKRLTGATTLRTINVQIDNMDNLEAAQSQITALLRQRHSIRPGAEDDFTVRNQQEIAEAASSTSRVLTILVGAIASVSLVVGGIGIMNIMLVSVTERTREIGIRMAVGAHGSDILMQFLIESVTLSCMGGLIGIALGIGCAKVISAVYGWPTLISLSSILTAFLFSAAVGVFFGFYPARKAAALDPIEALRYE